MPDAILKSADEAAALFDIHPESLRRMYREGRAPGYRVGRYLRFDVDELREAFRSHPRTSTHALAEPDFDSLEKVS